MTDEFDFPEFRPRPGRIRGQRMRPLSTLAKINQIAGNASRSGSSRPVGGGGLQGGRVRVSGSPPYATLPCRGSFDRRRVVVKARVHKLAGRGTQAAQAHASYLAREGVTKDGEPSRFYDGRSDEVDGDAFQERCSGDRHQFRFIVSPEDANDMAELKPFVRDLVRDMERDLGTRLDWIAIDHHDTGQPHTHLVLRGVRDDGADLVMPRDYVSRGIRERAEELVRLELGPPTREQQLAKLTAEVDRTGVTSLDRVLDRRADENRLVEPLKVRTHPARAMRPEHLVQRLRRLGTLGLAEEVAPARWRVADDLTGRLCALAERENRFAKIARAFEGHDAAPSPRDYGVFDPRRGESLTGRVRTTGVADEHLDRTYAVVEATDGRATYVDLGKRSETVSVRPGWVVTVTPSRVDASAADHTIAEIAGKHGGQYHEQLHREHDPKASSAFIRTHVRRLEAERRLGNGVRREDRSWTVPDDYLARVEDGRRAKARWSPVTIAVEAREPLAAYRGQTAATWPDRVLIGERVPALREHGFGREVIGVLKERSEWLEAKGHAQRGEDGRLAFRKTLLRDLERAEVARTGERLAGEIGKPFRPARHGDEVEGVYRKQVELASGRYALIEGERELALVPWRDVLERSRGREVSGVMRGRTVSWTLARRRGLER